MLFNGGYQFGCGLADDGQTGFQFFQFLALGPGSDIAKTVISGFNAEVLTDRIGDAFRFHFFGILFPLCLLHCFSGIMQLGVGDFMDAGRDGLNFAHALLYGDPLGFQIQIAVHILGNRLDLHRHRGGSLQCFQKHFILGNIPGQIHGELREWPAVCLGNIVDLDHFEIGYFNGLFLCDGFSISAQNGKPGIRVQFLHLNGFVEGRRGDDLNAVASFRIQDFSLELGFPFLSACHQSGIGHLGVDQYDIVQRIPVELAHGGKVVPVTVTLKQFLDSFFDASGYLFEAFFVGLFFSHENTPFDEIWIKKERSRAEVVIPAQERFA